MVSLDSPVREVQQYCNYLSLTKLTKKEGLVCPQLPPSLHLLSVIFQSSLHNEL